MLGRRTAGGRGGGFQLVGRGKPNNNHASVTLSMLTLALIRARSVRTEVHVWLPV